VVHRVVHRASYCQSLKACCTDCHCCRYQTTSASVTYQSAVHASQPSASSPWTRPTYPTVISAAKVHVTHSNPLSAVKFRNVSIRGNNVATPLFMKVAIIVVSHIHLTLSLHSHSLTLTHSLSPTHSHSHSLTLTHAPHPRLAIASTESLTSRATTSCRAPSLTSPSPTSLRSIMEMCRILRRGTVCGTRPPSRA
jgi:hypothetical protein